MKKISLLMVLLFWCCNSIATEATIALENAHVNPADIASVKRGAKFFANTCMVCHSMKYLRYNKLAKEQGVVYEKMPINSKILYFGAKPPDLSLTARVRGSNWIYTYLQSFYVDPKQPSGFNNLVMKNSAMPNILAPFQGTQILLPEKVQDLIYSNRSQWYDVLVLTKPGMMTAAEFDATIEDVVNFLTYAADPHQTERVHLGYWVIGFLIILFIFAYLLKQSYWQDVEKTDENNK